MIDQGPPLDAQCPSWAASLGYMGVAAAVCLSNCGSAVSHNGTPSRAESELNALMTIQHGTNGTWDHPIVTPVCIPNHVILLSHFPLLL